MKDKFPPCRWLELPTGCVPVSRISFLERGEKNINAPAVLFLHSANGTGSDWLPVMEALAEEFYCVAPNMIFRNKWEYDCISPEEAAGIIAAFATELGNPQLLVIGANDAADTVSAIIAGFPSVRVTGSIFVGSEPPENLKIPAGCVCLVKNIPEYLSDSSPDIRVVDTDEPEVIAAFARQFAGNFTTEYRKKQNKTAVTGKKRLSLLQLFDSVTPGAIFIIVILHILQFVRRLQGRYARPTGGGWRKLTRVFLGSEYSKFMLGCFRLTYAPVWGVPADRESAAALLAGRFAEFLMQTPELHWHVLPGRFSSVLRRSFFCDIVEVYTDPIGHITKLVPHFDARHPEWMELKREQLDIALDKIISTYNRYRKEPSTQRPRRIAADLRRWTKKGRGLSRNERKHMKQVVERIMCAAVIFCEQNPECGEKATNTTLPDMKRYRHPGWGMISVVARFSHDYSEADLWCQFNHVTADGAPMQEALMRLKKIWGEAGTPVYPQLSGIMSRAESVYCGDGIFRSRVFADFTALLDLRKSLNHYSRNFTDAGTVSLAALIMWGMSKHPYFRKKKILLPVDVRQPGSSAELDIMVICPGVFRTGQGELADFINFNREMNRKLDSIRAGSSESGEFLELCAMLHPLLYRFAGFVMQKKLQEIVGTVGLSILRDAEMFVSPLTDFQRNGFMTVGSVKMKTANGKKAGAISICGSKEQIRSYLEALKILFDEIPSLIQNDILQTGN